MRKHSEILLTLAVVFVTCLIVANIIAGKLITLPGGIILTAGVICFPIVYIVGDVVPEVYGLKVARRVIMLGFMANLMAVALFLVTLILPYPPFWQGQESFQVVLGFTPRLLLASFIAYLIGTNANAWVMVRVKKLTGERFLWVRTISSTIVGEGLDSLVFMTIAFVGTMPIAALPNLIIAQAVFKITYEVVATPLTYWVIGIVKRREGYDPAVGTVATD